MLILKGNFPYICHQAASGAVYKHPAVDINTGIATTINPYRGAGTANNQKGFAKIAGEYLRLAEPLPPQEVLGGDHNYLGEQDQRYETCDGRDNSVASNKVSNHNDILY